MIRGPTCRAASAYENDNFFRDDAFLIRDTRKPHLLTENVYATRLLELEYAFLPAGLSATKYTRSASEIATSYASR